MIVPKYIREFARRPEMDEVISALETVRDREGEAVIARARLSESLPHVRYAAGRLDGVEYAINVLKKLREEVADGEKETAG